MLQDSGSNLFLNLTLIQAAGSITGDIVSGEHNTSDQSIMIRLASAVSNYSHQVSITNTVQCSGGQVRISLRPLSSSSGDHETGVITKHLPCITRDMRTFQSTHDRDLSIVSDQEWSSGQCLVCLSSWLYWLDPGHWLEEVWPQPRIIILVIIVIVMIVVLIIFMKICCCVRNYTCCHRKHKSKDIEKS